MKNITFHISPLRSWLSYGPGPLIIAGPCSAESEEQVIQTARALQEIKNVAVFRAGIWKPRTRPEHFEGIGEKGLAWLQRVRRETGMKVAVEVAHPRHVETCLEHNIDILWLGARTVVNPFSVQDISEVLRGVDIPVMVKNPMHPDVGLWLGALERLNISGVHKLIAIHRGFYAYDNAIYRNIPRWEIPIEMKRLLPEIPVIVDPSHICGNRDCLQPVAQKALDLEMDGFMIEVHIEPQHALTDAEQQISPSGLSSLLDKLVFRKGHGSDEIGNKLEELRSRIDIIDEELLEVLSKRMEIVKAIGKFKKDHEITILQLKRWRNIISDRLEKGKKLGLNEDFLMRLLQEVHNEAILLQTKIMNEDNDEHLV